MEGKEKGSFCNRAKSRYGRRCLGGVIVLMSGKSGRTELGSSFFIDKEESDYVLMQEEEGQIDLPTSKSFWATHSMQEGPGLRH